MMRVVPLAVDLLFVLVFAAIGRASHGLDPLGILATAWPFLLACLVAWIVIAGLGDRGYGIREAVVAWLVTWVGGVALRTATGGTPDPAFIVVAGLFLALFLWGWRLVWHLARRTRAGATQ